MAAAIGKDGSVTIAGAAVALIDSWTINAEINTPEITAYGDSARAFGSALRGWNVTFSGTLDRSDTDQADLFDQFEDGTLADIALRMQTTTNNYWSGNVRLTSHSINSQVGDKVSITFSGVGNGALAYT